MRYLLSIAIAALVIPFIGHALDASYSTFSIGAPAIVTDTTTSCTTQTPVYYLFLNGGAAQVYDTTNTCTAAAPTTATINFDEIIFF